MDNNTMIKSETGFTLDTCAIIRICENRNVAAMLACRIDFENSPVYLNSMTVYEAGKKGLDKNAITSILKDRLGASVLYEPVTAGMNSAAMVLECHHSTLHYGDSQILAFSISKSTLLITRDKGLITAAIEAGSNAVNPDDLPVDM